MKVKVKSKEQLMKLFKKKGYIEQKNGWWDETWKFYFNNKMFKFCDEIISVENTLSDYDYIMKDGYWRSYGFIKEWLVIPSSLHLKEFEI